MGKMCVEHDAFCRKERKIEEKICTDINYIFTTRMNMLSTRHELPMNKLYHNPKRI